jgi:hypothetical protein
LPDDEVCIGDRYRIGDAVFEVSSGPEFLSVAEVDALLYLPGHLRATVQRALRIPALSPG